MILVHSAPRQNQLRKTLPVLCRWSMVFLSRYDLECSMVADSSNLDSTSVTQAHPLYVPAAQSQLYVESIPRYTEYCRLCEALLPPVAQMKEVN